MERRRTMRAESRSGEQIERDRMLREKFAGKPSLEDLQATGEFELSVKQGQYLALAQFAAAFRLLRQQLHLSLADLASKSGIDRAAISRLESGQADNPTIQTLERLAKSVGKRIRIEMEDDCPLASR